MKAMIRHYLEFSAKLPSFILEILLGYLAKNRAKSAHYLCHTNITLKTTMGKTLKVIDHHLTMGHFCLIAFPEVVTKN